jgi:predicted HTH domain antitoxin
MTIELPDVNLGSLPLTSEQARLDFAVGLYSGRHASLERAARLAGISYTDFMHELGKRDICLNYTVEDIEHDMRMVDELAANVATAA